MRSFWFVCALFSVVGPFAATADEDSQKRFSDAAAILIDNNYVACVTVNLKDVTDEMELADERNKCRISTLEDLAVLMAQYVNLEPMHEAEFRQLFQKAMETLDAKFTGENRKGLITNLIGGVRNLVETALIKPAMLGLDIIDEIWRAIVPHQLRPLESKVDSNFRGYAQKDSGDPIIIVGDKVECDASHVIAFRDALQDLVSDSLERYIVKKGQRDSDPKSILKEKDLIMAKVETFKRETVSKLAICEGLTVAIESIQNNLEKELSSLIQKAIVL